MSKDKIPLSSSLAFRTTVSVFVLTLGVLSAGGYFITSRIYDLNFENLRREAESAARFASKTLARPVWDMNQQGVSEILKSLSQNAVFCGAQVMDGDGKMFVDAGYPLTLSRDQSPVLEPIMFVDPAENANKIIGTLQVCVTAAPIRAQVWSIIDRLVISFALIAAGVLVALLASLRIILNPLRRFQDAYYGVSAYARHPITGP